MEIWSSLGGNKVIIIKKQEIVSQPVPGMKWEAEP